MSDGTRSDELTEVFARTSGLLLSGDTVASALHVVTTLAVLAIAGADGAGVTLTGPDGRRITAAGTSDAVERADGLQYELDEGPCLVAWQRREVVRCDDLAHEERWPRWAPEAAGMGLLSVLSAPLVFDGATLGAVKVYASQPDAFTSQDEHLMRLLGTQAALLVANAEAHRRAGSLSEAVRSSLERRDTINQAQGVVMARDHTGREAAFNQLVGIAERDGRTVYDVARRLVDTAARGQLRHG